MDMTEKTIASKEIFDGRVLHMFHDTVALSDGTTSLREIVRHPGGVCIAALDGENNLLFVRQFRYPYAEVVLELPAGKLEKGGTPLENGKRELFEETGAVGSSYISLGQVYPSPGYTDEIIHLYACRVASQGESQPDAGEFLNVEKIPLDKAVELVLNNMVSYAKTQIAVLKTKLLLDSGRI
ncbi:MAG: NUDIX hydrolase [Ruminococcus sp.]|nr:NUDIX hydrolase [Ruminococcus sp.]